MEKFNMLQTPQINYTQNSRNNISFKAGITKEMIELKNVMAQDSYLTLKSQSLLRKMNNLIDNKWTELKKQKATGVIPEFVHKTAKDTTITVKPLYNSIKKTVLFQVEKGKNIDRVIIERSVPNAYTYEHAVRTDFGSATTRTFDSRKNKNSEISKKVNNLIDEYFPKIFADANKKESHYIK